MSTFCLALDPIGTANTADNSQCYNIRVSNINTKKVSWDLTNLYQSDKDPQIGKDLEQMQKVYNNFVKKWIKRSDYLTDPAILLKALLELEALSDKDKRGFGSPGLYFWLKRQQDDRDKYIKTRFSEAEQISTNISNDTLFFTNRLSKIPVKFQKLFLNDKRLKPYKHYLESLFAQGKYELSENEEKIINSLSKPAYRDWTTLTKEFLSVESGQVLTDSGKKEEKTLSEMASLMFSTKSKVRKDALAVRLELTSRHIDSATAELNAILNYKQVDDGLRGINRPDFYRHLGDDMDSEVVDALLEAVESKYSQVHKLYKLKAKLMKKDKLEAYDVVAPIGNFKKNFTYSEAIALVGDTLNELDTEFFDIFKRLVEDGRFDVYPRKGKSGGAFCAYDSGSAPTYVFLNFTNNVDSVLTIAHEVGHAINAELMKNENSFNYGGSLATAEVASTFIEDFVLEKLSQLLPKKDKLALAVKKLEDITGTIHTQVSCYRFEQELHETYKNKNYLSKTEISRIFSKHMNKRRGPYIKDVDGMENMWVSWPHIRNFFYVYTYASGLIISMYMQHRLREDPSFIINVKQFLSTGSSKSPTDIFKELGLDITDRKFWLEGLKKVDSLLFNVEEMLN